MYDYHSPSKQNFKFCKIILCNPTINFQSIYATDTQGSWKINWAKELHR